jgi:hypothetical protein
MAPQIPEALLLQIQQLSGAPSPVWGAARQCALSTAVERELRPPARLRLHSTISRPNPLLVLSLCHMHYTHLGPLKKLQPQVTQESDICPASIALPTAACC